MAPFSLNPFQKMDSIMVGQKVAAIPDQPKIANQKMVLSGEGADEAMAGYLYFHKAPNSSELHKEAVRKLRDLHSFDCLRANKTGLAWGVEVRVPFLDSQWLDLVMGQIDPNLKLCNTQRMEKWLLRTSFQTEHILPQDILWRQKEQFSDGVGYGWIDALKARAKKTISASRCPQV